MNHVQIVNYAAVPEIGIAIGIEKMVLGHEKLDVYRLAIGYVAWAFEKSGKAQRTIPIPIPIAISIPIYREPAWFTEYLRTQRAQRTARNQLLVACCWLLVYDYDNGYDKRLRLTAVYHK